MPALSIHRLGLGFDALDRLQRVGLLTTFVMDGRDAGHLLLAIGLSKEKQIRKFLRGKLAIRGLVTRKDKRLLDSLLVNRG